MSRRNRRPERAHKVARLATAAATQGERAAAEAALGRLRASAGPQPGTVEAEFLARDEWEAKAIAAVAQRHGLACEASSTVAGIVVVMAPPALLDSALRPEVEAVLRFIEPLRLALQSSGSRIEHAGPSGPPAGRDRTDGA